jgi:hypothetical protein
MDEGQEARRFSITACFTVRAVSVVCVPFVAFVAASAAARAARIASTSISFSFSIFSRPVS